MDNLKDLYNATRTYELKNGLADTPRLSTPILKERIGNNENIAGKVHVWRKGEWREPTPKEWQSGDVLRHEFGKDWTEIRYEGGGDAAYPSISGTVIGSSGTWNKGHYSTTWKRSAFRLHANSERIAANAKLKAEWEKEKFQAQSKWPDAVLWEDCGRKPMWIDELEYRRKPDPVYVPWTAEDDLLGVKVRSKSQPLRKSQVIEQNPSFVWIGDAQYHTYADFFAYFEQLDGTPCGKVKEDGE